MRRGRERDREPVVRKGRERETASSEERERDRERRNESETARQGETFWLKIKRGSPLIQIHYT